MRAAAGPVLLGALLLVGCVAPAPPEGPTEAEISAQLEEQAAAYWEAIAPGEPMPSVEPIRVVQDYTEQWNEIRGCLEALELDGLDLDDDGAWSYPTDPELMRVFERAQWECAAAYPVDPGSPDHEYAHTREQARYLWDFYTTRLIPCMEAYGLPLAQIPSREQFIAEPWWSPYFALTQSPMTQPDLAMLDAACPPPPIPIQRPFSTG